MIETGHTGSTTPVEPAEVGTRAPSGGAGRDAFRCTIRDLDVPEWERYADQILRIEAASYEPARRDGPELFARIVREPRGVALVALRGAEVVGFAFGAPLELFPDVGGVTSDPEWRRWTTLYSADVTVGAPYRGSGVGTRLKRRQIERARRLGYRYIAGRSRVGLADAMMRVNARFGARPLQVLSDSYGDDLPSGDCIYYRIDLQPARRHARRGDECGRGEAR